MLFTSKRINLMLMIAVSGFLCFSCAKPEAPAQKPDDTENPDDPEKPGDESQWGTVSIADVLSGTLGEEYELTAQVVGANTHGVILSQDTQDYIYAFKGEAHGLGIGDIVTVKGVTSTRNGLVQFGSGCSLDKIKDGAYTFPEAKSISVEEITSYMSSPSIRYVQYEGTVLLSGNYTNFEIEGTDIVGSLDYMSEEFRQQYSGHRLSIKGWLFGSYKTYLYTVPVEVEDLGIKEQEVPEGAIYWNDFDKELSSQTFGDGGQWPYMDQFDGWRNEAGTGIADVSYSFQSMSIRTNQSSKGSLSLYEGSGKNNVFFSTAPNCFVIEKIAVPGENLRLSFGAQRYAQGASNTFIRSDFKVSLSEDGEIWSPSIQYDFSGVEDVPGQWRLATADFTLPAGTRTLYIRFEAKISSVNRLDDVLLVEGEGGQTIEFGAAEKVQEATISEVLAGELDNQYKIAGQVIGIHTKGFLVKDATGTILVFKKNHGINTGEFVTVEGALSEYGGMKQFGESSIVTKTADGTWTQPEPEEVGASYFDAYEAAPEIRYVCYEGTLSSERDQNYQWHYNVAVEGTEVMGSVSYPTGDLGIDKYVGAKVRVTGYVIGITGSDTKYVNTLTTGLEFTDAPEIPSESECLSVKELNKIVADLPSGAALKDYVGVVGYVAANNESGALYQVISLVDNTGEPGSGIIVKDDDFTEETLPVGTKVIISFDLATYDLNKGLPQIRKAMIYPTDQKAEIVVPTIDDTQCADYLGQYVRVKNLTAPESATTWVVNNKSTTTKFTGEHGNTVASYVTKYACYKDEEIAHVTADLLGVMEVYNDLYELIPTSMEDVAGFKKQ
ncbi:MAG: DUF5689 domain-containing protein [Candidatus Cryptobacteroides sp.]